MGLFYDHIPGSLIQWIEAQHLFYVSTAPLSESQHVNVSPKGVENTFRLVYDTSEAERKDNGDIEWKSIKTNTVWYEDLTGSGAETIAHVKENGRITLMFVAFEGPPKIVRMFGTARVFEFGTPEYEELLPPGKRQPGSRSAIWVDVHKVGTSCGFSIPFFAYKAPRNRLSRFALSKEQEEYDHYATFHRTKGLKNLWKKYNAKSIDGLPALEFAPESGRPLENWREKVKYEPDDESVASKESGKGKG
ncbi:hypothetical protein FA13DRAFT_1669014, partial [Coprinellus micaceus]